jgi:hypothetical protein
VRALTESEFLKDVASHEMTVIREDGVYRHLRFKKPGSTDMHFDLLTWPGSLCYTGDMGTYVFTRLRDMFEFFRTRPEGKEGLHINPGYWGEKLQAIERNGGFKEFSPDLFRQEIKEYLDSHEATDEVREAVEDEVLSHLDDGEDIACRAAYDFDFNGFSFEDFFEANLKDYTFRFLWCCYALSWGIRLYDSKQPAQGPAQHD